MPAPLWDTARAREGDAANGDVSSHGDEKSFVVANIARDDDARPRALDHQMVLIPADAIAIGARIDLNQITGFGRQRRFTGKGERLSRSHRQDSVFLGSRLRDAAESQKRQKYRKRVSGPAAHGDCLPSNIR